MVARQQFWRAIAGDAAPAHFIDQPHGRFVALGIGVASIERVAIENDAIETGRAPVKHDIETWAGLERWFLDHLEVQKQYDMRRSCPFGTIGNGVTDSDELIRLDLCRIFEAVRMRIAAFLIKEKAQGRLAPEANEEQLADYCIAVVQGAMFMGKIKRSSEATEATMREALAHVKRHVRPAS